MPDSITITYDIVSKKGERTCHPLQPKRKNIFLKYIF